MIRTDRPHRGRIMGKMLPNIQVSASFALLDTFHLR